MQWLLKKSRVNWSRKLRIFDRGILSMGSELRLRGARIVETEAG